MSEINLPSKIITLFQDHNIKQLIYVTLSQNMIEVKEEMQKGR